MHWCHVRDFIQIISYVESIIHRLVLAHRWREHKALATDAKPSWCSRYFIGAGLIQNLTKAPSVPILAIATGLVMERVHTVSPVFTEWWPSVPSRLGFRRSATSRPRRDRSTPFSTVSPVSLFWAPGSRSGCSLAFRLAREPAKTSFLCRKGLPAGVPLTAPSAIQLLQSQAGLMWSGDSFALRAEVPSRSWLRPENTFKEDLAELYEGFTHLAAQARPLPRPRSGGPGTLGWHTSQPANVLAAL